jgi:hypothetical protein
MEINSIIFISLTLALLKKSFTFRLAQTRLKMLYIQCIAKEPQQQQDDKNIRNFIHVIYT